MLMLGAILALGGLIQQPPTERCAYDRAVMLALDEKQFDQNITGGWRILASSGCDAEGADLIKLWREAHKNTAGILYWHEGQLRAKAGQTNAAISLFERSRRTPAEDAGFGWNLYVDGTIAFLRNDRKAAEAARSQLAILPRPPSFSPVGPDGKPIMVAWPPNLDVLDGFLSCWEQPYKAAYSCTRPVSNSHP